MFDNYSCLFIWLLILIKKIFLHYFCLIFPLNLALLNWNHGSSTVTSLRIVCVQHHRGSQLGRHKIFVVLINISGLRFTTITLTSLFSIRARLGANYGVINVHLCQVRGDNNTNCKRIKRRIEKKFWVEKWRKKDRNVIFGG